jgi:1-acyl-sn-glycerol-3-phosphate acyltransferase
MIANCAAAAVRLLTGATSRWVGCTPAETQRVYFANHTSNLDFILLWASLPRSLRIKTRPIAAHDYWTKSRLRLALADKIFHAVLIERKRVTRANNPIAPMLAALAEGCSLIIFPEGGRTLNEPAEFKNGIFHLARARPNLEFVPVYIQNLSRVLPKGEVLPIPILCSVHFGSPLYLQPNEEKSAFIQRAQKAMLDLIPAS